MPNLYRKRLVPLAVTLGTAACCLLGAGAGIASAGTHGRKISYDSHHANWQCTEGKNQNYKDDTSCFGLQVGSDSNTDPQSHVWVGVVTITWYHSNSDYSTTSCDVSKPVSKLQVGDYVTCHEQM